MDQSRAGGCWRLPLHLVVLVGLLGFRKMLPSTARPPLLPCCPSHRLPALTTLALCPKHAETGLGATFDEDTRRLACIAADGRPCSQSHLAGVPPRPGAKPPSVAEQQHAPDLSSCNFLDHLFYIARCPPTHHSLARAASSSP